MIYNNRELLPWIQAKLSQRPKMELRDVYKLLYQGVLGSEHMVTSSQAFAQRLVEEFETVEPGSNDPLIEGVHPAGRIVRVNLRPYKALSDDLEALSNACLDTARRKWGTMQDLHLIWKGVLDAFRNHELGAWSSKDIHEIEQLVKLNHYPPLHHSISYRQAYHPAYRLVAADLLQGKPFDTLLDLSWR